MDTDWVRLERHDRNQFGVKFGENRKRKLYRSQHDTVRSAMGEGLDANVNNGRGTLVWRQNL